MTATLSVLSPVPVDGTVLVSSTVLENEYPVWSSTTTFAKGERCISPASHRIYESLVDNNLGKDPTEISSQSGTTVYWLDVDVTNRWAMFDSEVSTQTQVASPLTVTLRPGGGFNALYLAGVDAESLTVTVKDKPGGSVIYSYTGSLEASAPGDYDEYFFDRFKPQTDFLASGIDQYTLAEVTVKLERTSGQVKCGALVIGDLRALGRTQRGATAKPKTYSYINTDSFGRTSIKRRKATKDMTASALLDISEANTVTDLIQSLLDVPAVWICSGLPEYGFLRVFGLGSGEISASSASLCQLSLSVQGLI